MKKIIALMLTVVLFGCTGNQPQQTSGTTAAPTKTETKQESLKVPQLDGPKRKIAVVNFEDKTADHWYKYDLGKGMADMLVTDLVKSNNFVVIEREMLDKIMSEQQLSMSGALAPTAVSKIGKLLGVNIIVTGGVTEFGVAEGGGRVGGWVLGQATGGLVSGVGVKTYTARVAVDVRMIDVTTGQILAAETANAQESDSKVNFDSWNLPDFSIGSDNFNTTMIGKATRRAINNLTAKISENAEKTPWKGYILKAAGNDIWINAGSKAGIKEGMKFVVRGTGEEITDAEGETFVIPGKEIAQIEVIQTMDKLAKVKVLSGGGIEKDFEVILK